MPGPEDNPADDVEPTEAEWDAFEAGRADECKRAMMEEEGPMPMTVAAHGPESPKTHEEARFFHDGFLAGATAYAAAVGHSALKSDNPKLCEVFDAQGWRTIELYEKLAETVLVCEHGVKDGDWCEPCNRSMKVAASQVERHVHVRAEEGSDRCKVCDLDLRDEIHLRMGEVR